MSTVIVQDHAADKAQDGAAAPVRRNVLSRLLTWYRAAVAEPETEREKAEWQKHSF